MSAPNAITGISPMCGLTVRNAAPRIPGAQSNTRADKAAGKQAMRKG